MVFLSVFYAIILICVNVSSDQKPHRHKVKTGKKQGESTLHVNY